MARRKTQPRRGDQARLKIDFNNWTNNAKCNFNFHIAIIFCHIKNQISNIKYADQNAKNTGVEQRGIDKHLTIRVKFFSFK
jgi:hypothetical protein